jgi:hypothetical protein
MAARKRTITVLTDPEPAEVQAGDYEPDTEAFLNEIGADGTTAVRIERKQEEGPHAGKFGFCSRRQATGTILEDIQREFGPGIYRLRYSDADSGRIKGQRDVLINAPVGHGTAAAAAAAASIPNPADERLNRLMETMITAMIARPPAPVVSPLDDLSKIVGVVAKLIPQPEAGTEGRALDLYIRGVEAGERQAKALAALVPSGSDSEGEALLKIGLPVVELIKQQMDMNRQTGGVGQVPQAAPGQAPRAPANEVDMPWWAVALRPYVGDLLVRARAGRNPRVYADMVVEDMPEAAISQVATLIADRDFVRQFLAAYPMFNESVETQVWIGEFIEGMREAVAEMESGDEPAEVVQPAGEIVNG